MFCPVDPAGPSHIQQKYLAPPSTNILSLMSLSVHLYRPSNHPHPPSPIQWDGAKPVPSGWFDRIKAVEVQITMMGKQQPLTGPVRR